MRGQSVGYIGLAIFSSRDSSMLSKTQAPNRMWYNGRARMAMSQPEACRRSVWQYGSGYVKRWISNTIGMLKRIMNSVEKEKQRKLQCRPGDAAGSA